MDETVGQHYIGHAGAEYFAWQRDSGIVGAELDVAKFARHIRPTDAVVDFGCGAAYLLERLPGSGKIGVEPNEHARAAAAARGVAVVASPLELPDASADVVVSNHALEHTLSPLDELRELRRVLRPGGRLVVWLPLDDWRTQRDPFRTDTNHHLFTWTPLLLSNLFVEAGFRVEEVNVVTHAWPPKTAMLLKVLPRRAWEVLAWATAVSRRQRQLEAVCVPAEA